MTTPQRESLRKKGSGARRKPIPMPLRIFARDHRVLDGVIARTLDEDSGIRLAPRVVNSRGAV
jgi:hypothetical protein